MLLFFTYDVEYYAQEKTCTSFYIKLWPDYCITKVFIRTVLKIFPIMLALCTILSETYYAQNYAGILGLGLGTYLDMALL